MLELLLGDRLAAHRFFAFAPAITAAFAAFAALAPSTASAAAGRDRRVAAVAIAPAVAAGFEVAIIGRLDIGDVQEAVAADAEIDEGRLDARLDVDDAALVDVADVALVARAFDVEFFQDAVLDNRDADLLRLEAR